MSTPSRLSLYADNVIEAGWLAALILAPLFFNPYGNRIFEPGKVVLVRTLAILMLAAWLIRCCEPYSPRAAGGNASPGKLQPTRLSTHLRTFCVSWFSKNPLTLPTLFVVIVESVSTLASVAPSQSVLGSYERAQGLYTTLSYVIIFFLTATTLRSTVQVERAMSVILLASFPVALYGVIQHYRLAPLDWPSTPGSLVSTIGNPIFVGAYLVLIIPLTLGRLLGVTGWLKRDLRAFLLLVLYASLLALQVVCLVFTQRRGPFLGLLGGLWAFAVLYALVRGARRIALAVVGLGVVSLVLLVLVNFWPPFKPWLLTPYAGRLAKVFDLQDHNTKVRVLAWEGTLQLMLPHTSLWSPIDGEDTLHSMRPLIGYGPESLHVIYHRVYSPLFVPLEGLTALPDRAHNETLDVLVTTGLFGVVAYLVFFSSLFLFGLQRLGFICTARQRRAFVTLWLGTGVATALGAGLSLGWHFVGIALPGGMIVGFFLYFVAFILWRGQSPPSSSPQAVLLVMLIAALLSHFIEIQFGIAVTATRTYFWFLAAVLIAVGTERFPDCEAASTVEEHGTGTNSMAPRIVFALLTSLTLITLAFNFVSVKKLVSDTIEGVRAIDVVIASLTSKITPDGPQPSFAMLWLFIGTFLLALVFGVTQWRRQSVRRDEWLFEGTGFTAMTLLIFFAYVSAQIFLSSGRDTIPLDGLVSTFRLFVLFLTGIVLLVGGVLMFAQPLPRTKQPRQPRIIRWWSSAVVLAVVVVAAGLIIKTNVSVVQADIIYRHTQRFAGAPAREEQIRLLQRALAMQLPQDYVFAFLGDAYLAYANQLTEPTKRDTVLAQAEEALRDAQELNPLNPEHTVRLGDLHLLWAGFVSDHAGKERHFQKSLDYYRQTVRLSPNLQPFSERYAQALREYSAFLADSQTAPAAPFPLSKRSHDIG